MVYTVGIKRLYVYRRVVVYIFSCFRCLYSSYNTRKGENIYKKKEDKKGRLKAV